MKNTAIVTSYTSKYFLQHSPAFTGRRIALARKGSPLLRLMTLFVAIALVVYILCVGLAVGGLKSPELSADTKAILQNGVDTYRP